MFLERFTSKPAYLLSGLFSLQLIWVVIGSLPLTLMFVESRWNEVENLENLFIRVSNAAQKGTVVSDDYMDMVVLSGQPVYYQPFEYGQLYHAGLWDPTALVRQVEEQDFPLVIIGGDSLDKDCCWPPQISQAFHSFYDVEHNPDILLLVPKQ
jgi:hypothetical protein